MYIHSVVSIMMEAEASAALRAPETFTSVYDGQHGMLPEAAHGPRCSAFYGSAVQGTMLQAGNLALCTLCISQVKITFISHLCFLVLIKRPSLSLRLIRKTVWGPFLWSGVKLWLCLHLSSEACIRPHLPKALWLTFRDSLICTNNVKMGIVC